jgi:hypothetical protein
MVIFILLAYFNSYGAGHTAISYRQKMKYTSLNQQEWENYQYNEISYGECKIEYVIPKETSESKIKTIFIFVGGGGWLDPAEFDLQGIWMPYDMDFLCKGRKTALFGQLSYKGVYPGYGLQAQLGDAIGAMKEFLMVFPNAEIYAYGFSAGVNVFFNTYMDMPVELQMQFRGVVCWSPAPDPSSRAFNWCIDLLANLPMTASMDDKLAEVRKFSCAERFKEKEISQKLRIVLLRGTIDELVTTSDFQNFKEILDGKSFVKTILYKEMGHALPWNPTIEELQAIEKLNLKNWMITDNPDPPAGMRNQIMYFRVR